MMTVQTQQATSRPAFNWRLFGILLGLGMLGIVAMFSAQLQQIPELTTSPDVPPLPILTVIVLVQGAITLIITVGIGLWLAPRMGMVVAPLLMRTATHYTWSRALLWGVPSGLAGGTLILLLDGALFSRWVAMPISVLEDVSPIRALAAAFLYGGITEELLLRLFLMTLLVWLLHFVWKDADGRPTTGTFWAANIIAAVIFGLAHLPVTVQFVAITPLVVARAVVLNGLVGVIFGWLYWRKGLETAMISHMSAHIVLTLIATIWLGT